MRVYTVGIIENTVDKRNDDGIFPQKSTKILFDLKTNVFFSYYL
jgi:hypothetical protein